MHPLGYENLTFFDDSMREWAKDKSLRKDVPFFVRHFGDREVIKAAGFTG